MLFILAPGQTSTQDLCESMTDHSKYPRKISPRAQSAMEYLTTYGWAILVIAVVVGVLANLGVFNPATFASRNPPGSCTVVRPNGPMTDTQLSLQGVCGGIPEYVANFMGNGAGAVYSSNTYAYVNINSMAGTNVIYTVTMWVNPATTDNNNMPLFGFQGYQAFELFRCGLNVQACELGLHRCTSGDTWSGAPLPIMTLGTWYFIAVTVAPPDYHFQVNNYGDNVTNTYGVNNNAEVVIGTQTAQCDGSVFQGYLSDVQLYNASLSANGLDALYAEGIGGAPIDLSSLVAWWPLNGDVNDYSGDGYNANSVGVIYSQSWTQGYSFP